MKDRLAALHQRLTSTVIGSDEAAFLLIVALLANGHVLIQGAPGIGKTTLARTLADSLHCTFNRVQFTPDLLPSDLLGCSLYHQGRSEFQFIPGPVFANILLADEINRTSPRIQSALLECMNEHQVTIDGVTRKLEAPFLVIATQNNVYSTGTFPLPEPQLDRFLLCINVEPPDAAMMARILGLHAASAPAAASALLDAPQIRAIQQSVLTVPVSDRICHYIAALCTAARQTEGIKSQLSPRAGLALLRAAQAVAWLDDHPAVYPDDVKRVALPVLAHRLTLRDAVDASGSTARQWIDHLLRTVPAP